VIGLRVRAQAAATGQSSTGFLLADGRGGTRAVLDAAAVLIFPSELCVSGEKASQLRYARRYADSTAFADRWGVRYAARAAEFERKPGAFMSATFTGEWKNQYGSILKLTESGGTLTGEFESGVGDNGQTLWVEVAGRVLDDVVTFHAAYPDLGTLVSWTGQMTSDAGGDVIRTQWLHATNVCDPNEPEWLWAATRIGADKFHRVGP
jgi:hypothetical protein